MNAKQMSCVLSDIGTQAAALQRLVNLLINATDRRDTEALTESIAAVASRIGMVADMALQQVDGALVARGDVAQWTMPPRYFEAPAARPETVKG